jgi:hypothetical protein
MMQISMADPASTNTVYLAVKGFPGGALWGDDPTVALVISSTAGEVLGHFQVRPEDAHILSEYVRKAAEAANKEENQA